MLLFGRGFFFFFLSLGTTRLCFRPSGSEAESVNTAYADTPSLSLHNVVGLHVRNSRHSMSSEMLCVQKMFLVRNRMFQIYVGVIHAKFFFVFVHEHFFLFY